MKIDTFKGLPKHLRKKDMVIISNKDIDKLFEWKDRHKEAVRGFTAFTDSILFCLDNYYVDVEPSPEKEYSYRFTVYMYANEKNRKELYKMLMQDWNRETLEGNTLIDNFPRSQMFKKHAFITSVITLFCSFMAYVEQDKKIIYRQVAMVKKEKKKKGHKRSKSTVTYIKKHVYRIIGEIETETSTDTEVQKEKRRYTSPERPFTVRGHWRQYKNGKRVWIPSYMKNLKEGKNKQPQPKIYKI